MRVIPVGGKILSSIGNRSSVKRKRLSSPLVSTVPEALASSFLFSVAAIIWHTRSSHLIQSGAVFFFLFGGSPCLVVAYLLVYVVTVEETLVEGAVAMGAVTVGAVGAMGTVPVVVVIIKTTPPWPLPT